MVDYITTFITMQEYKQVRPNKEPFKIRSFIRYKSIRQMTPSDAGIIPTNTYLHVCHNNTCTWMLKSPDRQHSHYNDSQLYLFESIDTKDTMKID